MGLDITFFKKVDQGFEEIISYRNTMELSYWVKVNQYDQREPIQVAIDHDVYDLIKVSHGEIEDLIERAITTLENDIKTTKFSDGYCLLPRGDVADMKKWNDESFDEYIEDLNSYIEKFKDSKKDIYIHMSY